MNFQRFADTPLYTAEGQPDAGGGFLGYLLCGDTSLPPASISVAESWDAYTGYYLFLREAPADLGAFAAAVEQQLGPTDPSHAGFAWLDYAAPDEAPDTVLLIKTVAADGAVAVEADVTLFMGNYGLPFKQAAPVVPRREQDDITGFVFEYPPFAGAPAPSPTHALYLPLAGEAGGSVTTEVAIGDFSDWYQTGWNVGCRYFVESGQGVLSQYYPVFELEENQQVLFLLRWDPVDQLNPERTFLAFSGVSFRLAQDEAESGSYHLAALKHPHALRTYFRTIYGEQVSLFPVTDSDHPAKLVFDRLPTDPAGHGGAAARYYLAPAGDFELAVLDKEAGAGADVQGYNLLCGLAGTEYVGFTSRTPETPGDILRFHPRMAAFAPRFPLPPVNLREPNSPPVNDRLLDETYTTSWVTVTPHPPGAGGSAALTYYSQPHGAALYANEAPTKTGEPPTLDYYQTKMADLGGAAAADSFPLAPYAGVVAGGLPGESPGEAVRRFEAEIISPTRKQSILSLKQKAGYFAQPAALAAGSATKPTTTPQGLLATIATDAAARWQTLLLARNVVQGAEYRLVFEDVDPALQDAFQTNQQFLVVTRPKSAWGVPGGTQFANLMLIEDWPFRLAVGEGNVLGDYRNVLIFKFVSGKLSEQVKNPSNWTSAEQFNDTESQGLAFLSQWLQDYIEQARVMAADELRQGGGGYFQNFLDIVDSETWNGILALRVHIDLTRFPPELKGLLGGIDLTRFYAHHFGVEVNFVQAEGGGLGISGNSSLFGLIYYTDPAYENQLALGGSPDRPVAAAAGDYDFKVLTLKVLFENTAVKTFESKCQVTVNRWFDDRVTNIVEPSGAVVSLPSNSIILDGAYEEHDGQSTFTFSSRSDQLFRLDSNVLGVVEVVQAQFSTLTDAGGAGALVQSRFTFTGFMNFMPAAKFDLFSFGSDWPEGAPGARQGLYFANLYLDMSFPEATPTDRTFTFDPNLMAFNVERSRARPGSLFQNFPLKLEGLTSGTAEQSPAKLGYLPVSVEAPFTGLRGPWNGLLMQLDMGTVGALAENAGLIAMLVGAWSPGSGGTKGAYDVMAGLRLPGAGGGGGEGKLLSLQGILSLSVGAIELLLGETQGQPPRPAYMLKMTQLALKFLGVKFPPSGNTVFFLFGDPNPGAPQNSLGWYAAYNKDNKQALPAAGAAEGLARGEEQTP